jgi:hypothetical protein
MYPLAESLDNITENLIFTGRKRCDAISNRLDFAQSRPILPVFFDGVLDGLQELYVVERLLKGIDSPLLHGFDRYGNITVCRDDDNGHAMAEPCQLLLEVKTRHPQHEQVQHNATDAVESLPPKKLLCRSESLASITRRFWQDRQSLTERCIVVDNINACRFHIHLTLPAV